MSNTKLALILAAGNGSRLAARSGELPKPLVQLHGKPLLGHVMGGAHLAGIERFVIVLGYRGHKIQQWYESHPMEGVQVTWVENPDYHKNNGVSVLRAQPVIQEPFLLMMADHMFDPANARALLRHPLGKEQVFLAVDRNIDRVFDIDDATKVRLNGDRIVDIGKDLERYDALDTGMFHCDPVLFRWLAKAMKDGNCSLSDGMRLMAQNGTFKAFDIGEGYWQDVDTPEALEYALQSLPLQPELIHNTTGTGFVYA
jgi:1L-myo-inositol 1-phosphate cytidylyltransferase